MRPEALLLLGLLATLPACSPEDTGKIDEQPDADGDGSPDAEDCAPDDVYVHPGAIETCNGVDDNCDGQIDEGLLLTFYQDSDGDGYGATALSVETCRMEEGYAVEGGDCDDADTSVRPGGTEICNGADDDCDGAIDENGDTTYFADADGDGWGDEGAPMDACDLPDGYAEVAGDCDDTDPTSYPGGDEVCDEADNNCDTRVDEGVTRVFYQDADGDGYGTSEVEVLACEAPRGYAATTGDCDDSNATLSPGLEDVCDGIDNDCSTVIDNVFGGSLHFDGENDTLVMEDCPSIDLLAGPLTFEAWIYTEVDMTEAPILAKEGSGTYQYWFGIYNGRFGMMLGTTYGWGLSARSSGAVRSYQWMHLASVWDGTTWYNYQDGVLATNGSGSYSSTISDTSAPLTIGSNSTTDSTRFTGNLADVRIWNVARSEADILANMVDLGDTTGLVGRWLLDDGAGDQAIDLVAGCNGRLGSAVGDDDRDPAWSPDALTCE